MTWAYFYANIRFENVYSIEEKLLKTPSVLHQELSKGGIGGISVVYGSVEFNWDVEELLKSLAESAFGKECAWRSFDSNPQDRVYYWLYNEKPIAMGILPTYILASPYQGSYLGEGLLIDKTASLTHFCVHGDLRNLGIYGALVLETMLGTLVENNIGSVVFTTDTPSFYEKATPEGFELIKLTEKYRGFLEMNGRQELLEKVGKVFYCIRLL